MQGYLAQEKDPYKVILHAEEALRLQPAKEDETFLHLALFNAYLQKIKLEELVEIPRAAADHLYLASQKMQLPADKRRWLISYYASHALQCNQLEDARLALELALPFSEDKENWHEFENEILMICEMFGILEEQKQEEEMLLQLLTLQQEPNGLEWKTKAKSLVLYAELLLSHDCFQEAVDIASQLFSDPEVGARAKLCFARAKWSQASPSEKTFTSHSMQTVLELLKELQARKVLKQEPLHLEAALAYAEICAQLDPFPFMKNLYFLYFSR